MLHSVFRQWGNKNNLQKKKTVSNCAMFHISSRPMKALSVASALL